MRGRREAEVVGGASFTRWFDIDEIAKIGWFRFLEKIVSHRYYFVRYALFDLEPVKRFEGRSDM